LIAADASIKHEHLGKVRAELYFYLLFAIGMFKERCVSFQSLVILTAKLFFDPFGIENKIASIWIAPFAKRVDDLVGRKRQGVDRYGIALVEPKFNCGSQLPMCGLHLSDLEGTTSMARSSDPTKDPDFQRVVQRFLHTPPQPHKPAKAKGRSKTGKAKKPGDSPPTRRITGFQRIGFRGWSIQSST
jgi:hypothetical protein